jgi:hypothetical protein
MPVDGRLFMLQVHAVVEARQIVRARLRRENCKPSHYAHAEIGRMAMQYLNTGHWPEYIALALPRSWRRLACGGNGIAKACGTRH